MMMMMMMTMDVSSNEWRLMDQQDNSVGLTRFSYSVVRVSTVRHSLSCSEGGGRSATIEWKEWKEWKEWIDCRTGHHDKVQASPTLVKLTHDHDGIVKNRIEGSRQLLA